jgi:hypothetical protein
VRGIKLEGVGEGGEGCGCGGCVRLGWRDVRGVIGIEGACRLLESRPCKLMAYNPFLNDFLKLHCSGIVPFSLL